MTDLLRDIVNAATPGPWEMVWDPGPYGPYPTVAGPDGSWIGTELDDDEDAGKRRAIATKRFIATFDPTLMSALLDLRDFAREFAGNHPGDDAECERCRVRAALDRLAALEDTP